MATLPNVTIEVVPSEAPGDPDFPTLDPINTFDLVGPTAANRQPLALKQRDFTLRDRVNLLIANMNAISTGGASSAVLFLPRDGTNPMTGDLDMGGYKLTGVGVLLPTPSDPPDEYVQVSAGTYQKTSGKGYKTVGAQSKVIGPITTNPRYDVLYIDDAGALQLVAGSEGGSVPEFPDNGLALARVYIDETTTVVINDSDITDVRPFLSADQDTRRIQNRPVDSVAPSTDDGLVWDGAKWAPQSFASGWRLKYEISAESALSAVTVGEGGCDFTTIAAAITYVNALTPTVTRQCAIYLFEKRDGQDWLLSANLSMPNYTHLIGMGRPTIKMANYKITVPVGSSLRDLHLQSTVASTTVPMIEISGADARLENLRFTCTTSQERKYCVVMASGADNYTVIGCDFIQCVGGVGNATFVYPNTGYGLISDCFFQLGIVGTNQMACISFARDCRITGCLFEVSDGASGNVHYGIQMVSNCVFSGNTVRSVAAVGAYVMGIEVAGGGSSHCVVADNRIGEDTHELNQGIRVTGDDHTISGNSIRVSNGTVSTMIPEGIRCDSNPMHTAISGNTIYATRLGTTVGSVIGIVVVPIAAASVHVTISGNKIYAENTYDNAGSEVYGIFVNNLTTPATDVNISIGDNVIECIMAGESGTGAGVLIKDATAATPRTSYDITVSGNTIRTTQSTAADGVICDASHVTITGNNIRSVTGTSVELVSTQSQNCVVVGNVLNGAVGNKGGTGVIVAHNIGDP